MDWEAVWQYVRLAALNADAVAARYPDDLAVRALRTDLQALERLLVTTGATHHGLQGDVESARLQRNDDAAHASLDKGNARLANTPRRPVKVRARGVLDGSEDWDRLVDD
ncbi:MAG: hypothetical protein ACK4JZ_09775 [Hydrogenophilus thermoluteolus]|uniref:hypothetical protein n=1 Tax=Hydrogenophilus thermoluteolus TaxID=297 RepID=UPI0024A59AD9|nr:hypothetical protein [Hydrogenophilus thermoluteolus]GLW61392.1 hypothetical protein Hthe01_17410 [Hydrogenophilus thermoluteolus]